MKTKRLFLLFLGLVLLIIQGSWHITYAQAGKELQGDFLTSPVNHVVLRPRFDMLAVGVPYEDIDGVEDTGIVQVFRSSPEPGRLILDGPYWDQGGGNELGDHFGRAIVSGDFNGDGYYDLAVGVPGDDYETNVVLPDHGIVIVLYGNRNLLTGHEFLSPPSVESYIRFGEALAVGDFNGDGYDDLAVGAPGKKLGDVDDAGWVYVFYGRANGLIGGGSWHQDSAGIRGMAETGDRFGSSLAAGDFNGDGYDDLAVGVPLEDVEDQEDAGAVNVLFGSSIGLQAGGNELLIQGYFGLPDSPKEGDQFGRALTAGDFNKDGYDDLAIGAPFKDVIKIIYNPPSPPASVLVRDLGAVFVVLGDASGLADNPSYAFTHLTFEEEVSSEEGDAFGRTLAAGDLNGDGYDDLAIGIPYKDIAGKQDAGAVVVLFGDAQGVQGTNPYQYLHQDAASFIESIVEPSDLFGFALTTGDFNGDGREDLAVGVPGEDYIPEGRSGTVQNAGVVQVFYDLGSGRLQSDQLFGQDLPQSVEGMAETGDQFGYSLATMRGPTLYLPMTLDRDWH